MINLIETDKLKEHHKNGYYFTDIEGEKYEEVKRSIEAQGIRDPIKCTRDYTVISGHQRLRIARDLGMEKVPYQMLDVDEDEAEYLLIAENVERRGQAETDPIKKSRISNFLKEYWGVRNGGDRKSDSHNAQLKTTEDIAESIGESIHQTRRILKLHDLIPQLQRLVSAGKLGTTAGEQLAYLTPEVQSALYEQLGEEIAEKTVAETKQLRKDVDGKTTDEVVEIVKRENERLKEELRQKDAELLRAKTPKVEYKEVIREVVPEDVRRKLAEIERERNELQTTLADTYEELQKHKKQSRLTSMQQESPLYDVYRSLAVSNGHLKSLLDVGEFFEEIVQGSDKSVSERLTVEVKQIMTNLKRIENVLDEKNNVVDVVTY